MDAMLQPAQQFFGPTWWALIWTLAKIIAIALPLILAVAYLTCVAVVVGVIAVRYHYFTDTVAGAAVGIGTVCGLALAGSFSRP